MSSTAKSGWQYAHELQDAIAAGTEYATVACMDNERRYLLCTELPNSEWYLLSMMPFGTLDRILQDLSLELPVRNTADVFYYHWRHCHHFYDLL